MDQRVASAVASKLDAEVENKVQSRVDDALTNRFNEIFPTVVSSLQDFFRNNQQGPIPVISLGGSNSNNKPPTTRAQGAPISVTPPTGNAGAREHSPAMGGYQQPLSHLHVLPRSDGTIRARQPQGS